VLIGTACPRRTLSILPSIWLTIYILKEMNISTPQMGHWQRLQYGKPVEIRSLSDSIGIISFLALRWPNRLINVLQFGNSLLFLAVLFCVREKFFRKALRVFSQAAEERIFRGYQISAAII
jgi:hypothetical protein